MKTLIIILSIITFFAVLISYLPKGNDMIQFENDMIKIEKFNYKKQ